MPLTATGRNNLLTNGLTSFTHIGLLTALTATESTGARQAVTWTAAAGGIRDNNAQLTLPAGASETIVAGAAWDAVSAGNQQAYFGLGSTLRGVASVDAIATDLLQSDGHGLVADDRVFFYAVAGEAIPAGLSASTLYFVRATGLTTDAFTVALTSGGAAVDITALGEVAFSKTVPEVFSASGGNVVIATGALDLDANFV